MEWPPKPSKTILVTKKCCQKALELKNWENGHFERFYNKFDHFWSGSNLTGWLPLKWCLRVKIHFITFESWYKSQKTNTLSLKNPAQIHETCFCKEQKTYPVGQIDHSWSWSNLIGSLPLKGQLWVKIHFFPLEN